MRTLLFLNTRTASLDTEENRILQIGTRLVTDNEVHESNLLIHPGGFFIPSSTTKICASHDCVTTAQSVSIDQALKLLIEQLRLAEIIIGHNIANDIAIILTEARRAGQQNIIKLLSNPLFGFDGGARAAICMQELAADYFRYLDKPASSSNNKLATVYQKLFDEDLSGTHDALANAIACQRMYNFLRSFQLEQGVEFSVDIICLVD